MEPESLSDSNQLEQALMQLQTCEQQIREVVKYMVSNTDLFPMDLLTSAVLNRSFALLNGFTVLMQSKNTLAALHLVRLQLDSLLRYSAAWLVDEPHSFANEVLSGEPVKKLKDRTGAFMQDWYLVKKLTEEFPWVSSVYKETSGYVHLSEKHFHSSTRLKKGEADVLETVIAKDDRFIPEHLKIEATEAMFEITTRICGYAFGWADTKHGNAPGSPRLPTSY